MPLNSRASCVPESAAHVAPPVVETVSPASRTAMPFNVLDISRVIDIYAESRAVEAFDAEMGKERVGALQKIKGFFARSFQRMGRDAWIESQKRLFIKKTETELKNGEITEDYLRTHVVSGIEGIETDAHLSQETLRKDERVSTRLQDIADEWLATAPNSAERKAKTAEIKTTLESEYPITAELSQLEASLLQIERAKLLSEIESIELKLNLLDIGRMENGRGEREAGAFVKFADWANRGISESRLPDWLKQKAYGVLAHPNTAAIGTALLTRFAVSGVVGAAAVASFAGGILVPIAAGAAVGGLFAGVRAKREIRDRTAQIDRRGATGLETGNPEVDGISSNPTIHNTQNRQAPVAEAYRSLEIFEALAEKSETDIEIARKTAICYLVRRRVGREQSLNLLQFSNEVSVSRQNVDMLRMIDRLFPTLKLAFNDGSLFEEENKTPEAITAKELYAAFSAETSTHMDDRAKAEKQYAIKQGLMYAGIAAVVGSSVQGVLELTTGGGHYESVTRTPGSTTPPVTTTHYPDDLVSTKVVRGSWFDNGTPAPVFEGTELGVRIDKAGNCNVSNMLGKMATSSANGLGRLQIDSSLFSNGDIQAAIFMKSSPEPIMLNIDAQGNVNIPDSLREAIGDRTFSRLEIVKTSPLPNGVSQIHALATVKGMGTFNLEMITEVIPGKPIDPVIVKTWVSDPGLYALAPLGGTPYDELKKKNPVVEELAPIPETILPPVGTTPHPEPRPTTTDSSSELENNTHYKQLYDEYLNDGMPYAEAMEKHPDKKELLNTLDLILSSDERRTAYETRTKSAQNDIERIIGKLPEGSYDTTIPVRPMIHRLYLSYLQAYMYPKTSTIELVDDPLTDERIHSNIVAHLAGLLVGIKCFEKKDFSIMDTNDETKAILANKKPADHGVEDIIRLGYGLIAKYDVEEVSTPPLEEVDIPLPEEPEAATSKVPESPETEPKATDIIEDTQTTAGAALDSDQAIAELRIGRLPMTKAKLAEYTAREIRFKDVRSIGGLMKKSAEKGVKFYPHFIMFDGKVGIIRDVSGPNGSQRVTVGKRGSKATTVVDIYEFVKMVNLAVNRWKVILNEKNMARKKRA